MEFSECKLIDCKLTGAIANLQLQRPEKKNALNLAMVREFQAVLNDLAQHPQINLVRITALGDYFCAGLDLHWILSPDLDFSPLGQLFYQLATFPHPLLAEVTGGAAGGGLGILAACDVVIAAENAKFRFAEVSLGLIPAIISPLIYAAIGQRAANRYFLTAEEFDAQTAKNLGLLHEVTPVDSLPLLSQKFVAMLLANSASALRACKKLGQESNHQHLNPELFKNLSQKLQICAQDTLIQHKIKKLLSKD